MKFWGGFKGFCGEFFFWGGTISEDADLRRESGVLVVGGLSRLPLEVVGV